MTVNGVDGGNQPLNSPKPTEPKVVKNNVDKGSIFKQQVTNEQGQLVRELTYYDFDQSGTITSNELYAVAQYTYDKNGTTINQMYDKDHDGMADAKFETYTYDNQIQLTQKQEQENEANTKTPLANFAEYTEEQQTANQPTQNTPEIVKTGIEKGAEYREQIMENDKLIAEFVYHDYNKDGNIDTSEMYCATTYQYGENGVTAHQKYDKDRDSKFDSTTIKYKWDKDNNPIGTPEKREDSTWNSIDIVSYRNAYTRSEQENE